MIFGPAATCGHSEYVRRRTRLPFQTSRFPPLRSARQFSRNRTRNVVPSGPHIVPESSVNARRIRRPNRAPRTASCARPSSLEKVNRHSGPGKPNDSRAVAAESCARPSAETRAGIASPPRSAVEKPCGEYRSTTKDFVASGSPGGKYAPKSESQALTKAHSRRRSSAGSTKSSGTRTRRSTRVPVASDCTISSTSDGWTRP